MACRCCYGEGWGVTMPCMWCSGVLLACWGVMGCITTGCGGVLLSGGVGCYHEIGWGWVG